MVKFGGAVRPAQAAVPIRRLQQHLELDDSSVSPVANGHRLFPSRASRVANGYSQKLGNYR